MGLRWERPLWMRLAALSGFVAVAVGAFAAHGVSEPEAKEWLRLGAQYEFMHAMATFACATFMNIGGLRARWAPAFFLSGTLFFSGSLYAMGLGGPRILGAITPIGGLLFLIGWAILVWAASTIDRPARD